MPAKRINFTKAKLERIEPPLKPEGKKGGVFDTYYDTGEKGLVLLVSNGGAKTFYLYKRVNGTPKRIKIGSFPDLSVENARKAAMKNKGLIAGGGDPHEEAKLDKAKGTLATFFYEHYIPNHAKKHKKTWQQDEKNFELYLKPLRNKPFLKITRHQVESLHNSIATNNGKYASNRILALVHSIYNRGIEEDMCKENPAHGIKKFKEKSRERFLQPEEMPRFFAALDAEPNDTMKDYFYMLLLTGARRQNVASMHWRDISLDLAAWTIHDTKNGDPYTVNLPTPALEVLGRRISTKGDGWVFPSATSKSGHIEEPKSAWKRILQRAEIEDLRVHDLRRTLGSYQAIGGSNQYVIGKSLGHKSGAATAIYARLNADPVRESVEKATATLIELGRGHDVDTRV